MAASAHEAARPIQGQQAALDMDFRRRSQVTSVDFRYFQQVGSKRRKR
jgi:hypothetical protein